MKAIRTMSIYFTDDTKLTLIFPKQVEDASVMLNKLDRALKANQLLLEHDGQLLIIPQHNIKYIQVEPAPERLPEQAILAAQLISENEEII